MRIIHITDLHVAPLSESPREIDTHRQVERVLSAVKQYEASHLIVTGDLCWDVGHADIYKRLRQQLDDLDLPYFCISGNHDDPKLLAKHFDQEHRLDSNGELYYSTEIQKWPCIFLDTTPGKISSTQLDWLSHQLKLIDHPVLLFIHHPPTEVPVWFMERKYPLHNRKELLAILHRFAHPVYTFCGHYHAEFSVVHKNVHVYMTPSCFFQIEPFALEFTEDHRIPALRIIDMHEQMVRTTVRYLWEKKW